MRNRIIHPGLATNDELAEASIEARYLAALLPCHCDREGRIENRPKRISILIFPYDKNIKIVELINQLLEVGYLDSYTADGIEVLQIRNFNKYQKIHKREADSTLPSKPKNYPGTPKADLGRQEMQSPLYEVEVEVEVTNKKNGQAKNTPPPPRAGFEFFRCSDHEWGLAEARYQREKIPIELLPYAADEVERWLANGKGKALTARQDKTHHRRLSDTWAIEKAQKRLEIIQGGKSSRKSTHEQQREAMLRGASLSRAKDEPIDITPGGV